MKDFVNRKARPEIFALKEYIPGKPIEEVKRELGLEDIIKMASNENPLGPSAMAVKAITNTLGQLHLYPDSNCFNLKQKLAERFNVPVEALLIGNGSDELLRLIAETFLTAGDEIIVGAPTFSEYEFTAMVMGARCVPIPLHDYKNDLDAMLKAITPQSKMLVICNPNNPTGTIVTEAALDEMMQKVPEDLLVVFDEAYSEYVQDKNFVSGLKYVEQGRNAIVLKTFSKIYGLAALRVGYAITTEEIAMAVKRVCEPFNVNMLAQVGATAAIDDQEHLEKSLAVNETGKKYLYDAFSEMGIVYVPTQANFILFDARRDAREVFQSMLQQGVIIRNCTSFGYPTFLRVTVGTMEQNERFIKTLKQILQA